MSKSIISKSEALLFATKTQADTTSLRSELAVIDVAQLKAELDADNSKKTFWINIYNAFFQILRKEQNIGKPDIYRKRLLTIAKNEFSLDDVEHGILRRYRYKYSLGFIANIFAPKLIKSLAVDEIDYRIHFALNCGAKSCPPIAFYKLEAIDQQLDLATQSFLEGETQYDDERKEVHMTTLFKWFAADFGGRKGIRRIYKDQLNKDISGYKIRYKEYSWEEELDNYM